jgi:hypothetical protein
LLLFSVLFHARIQFVCGICFIQYHIHTNISNTSYIMKKKNNVSMERMREYKK